MGVNPIAGTGVFLLGGVAAALYLLPFRAVKGWSYERGWLLSVIAGWLVFPLVFDWFVVPDVFAVLRSDGWVTLARTVGFGALWGVGALAWALMVRYLGVGLGLAIGAGLCAAAGTLLPPIVTGNAVSLVATRGACVVLGGVLLSLVGIALVGAAGKFKEGEMDEAAKKKAVAEYDFRKGVVTAVVAGVASAGINFGLQGAPAWEKVALDQGASPLWAGMPVLTATLWGGVLTQVLWVTYKTFTTRGATPNPRAQAPSLLPNLALCVLSGVMGVSQFVLQKLGEPLMGEMRYISFAVLMASAIFFSTAVGLFLGEWRQTGRRTRCCLASGIGILLLAFIVISLGGRPD